MGEQLMALRQLFEKYWLNREVQVAHETFEVRDKKQVMLNNFERGKVIGVLSVSVRKGYNTVATLEVKYSDGGTGTVRSDEAVIVARPNAV